VVDPQAIVFAGQGVPNLAQTLIDRTRILDRPRYGARRRTLKLIISEIATDASSTGAAVVPFKSPFY
jgi:predicted NBD/HSP70 family sugar kinase